MLLYTLLGIEDGLYSLILASSLCIGQPYNFDREQLDSGEKIA